jgi:magnesium chelatase subunit D
MTLAFTDIVGLDTAKQALLLLAANPALGGVAMAATVGSGKSTLARAFATLLPAGAPFVELPLNATEDRMIGGLDLEATLTTGQRVVERGLLARADGGVLYVDGLNRLDGGCVAHLLEAMAGGVVRVEREGLSARHPARFVLIGTYDTGDGDVRRSLLDRLGLIVPFAPQGDARLRAEVMRAHLGSAADSADEVEVLRELIAAARAQLPSVVIRDEQIEALAQTALSLGVEGNRADVFAVQAALAKAALDGRGAVDDDDLRLAVRLTLLPRATRLPEEPAQDQPPQQAPQAQTRSDERPDRPEDDALVEAPEEQRIEDLLLSAATAELPEHLLALPFAMQRRGGSGSRGAALNDKRGRFVAAAEGALRGHRIALLPTLLAAAPWQRTRRAERAALPPTYICPPVRLDLRPADIRIKRFRDKAGMLYIFVVDASGSMALNRMREAKGAAIRLLQDAYVHRDQVALIAFRGAQAQVLLAPSQSVERAKRELDVLPTGGGTPLAAALLAAWETARLARSRGVAQATVVLMTDGRANVAWGASRPAAAKGDAGAAAGKDEIRREIESLAGVLRADGVNAVVIDTQANYLSRGEAPRLAQWLGGRYVYLPNAKAAQIAQVVA